MITLKTLMTPFYCSLNGKPVTSSPSNEWSYTTRGAFGRCLSSSPPTEASLATLHGLQFMTGKCRLPENPGENNNAGAGSDCPKTEAEKDARSCVRLEEVVGRKMYGFVFVTAECACEMTVVNCVSGRVQNPCPGV
ncbi:hypothetical protein BaRGS_00029061 [Batillaria attramentaria]|uniref:Uncharacterized protein n=1 Tax=Batillaria attramentaria TaxID=370345 RepID=A0ABD0JYA2_9CAEN